MSNGYTYHPPRSDEAAWAAGVFEGEGSISSQAGRTAASPRRWQLIVQMTDHDVLVRLNEVLQCGTVRGPYEAKTPAGGIGKPVWSWKVTKQSDVIHVLALLLPYLGKRRKSKALEAMASIAPRLVARSA